LQSPIASAYERALTVKGRDRSASIHTNEVIGLSARGLRLEQSMLFMRPEVRALRSL
jgi:hypothetical protein